MKFVKFAGLRKRLTEALKDLEFLLNPAGATTSKSINEVVRDYDDALTRFVFDVLNGNMSKRDMAQAHKALVRKLGPDVYFEGMREAGIDEPEKEADEVDDEAIENWLDEQVSRVDGFADWLSIQDNTESVRREAVRRIDLWIQALSTFGAQGRASAQRNALCEWEWDELIEEHCVTCERLNGTRHRLSWFLKRNYIPQKPGAGMKCGGFRCGCKLRNVKTGEVVLP